MKRIVFSLVFAASIGIAVAACDDHDHDYDRAYGGGDDTAYCGEATTCGACTPLDGCGWCFNADGTGTCTTGPDQCTTQEFSWTWEPSGCRETADAGVVGATDAAVSTPDGAAIAIDAADEAEASAVP
jgi:hypothetical protein